MLYVLFVKKGPLMCFRGGGCGGQQAVVKDYTFIFFGPFPLVLKLVNRQCNVVFSNISMEDTFNIVFIDLFIH